MQIPHYIEQTIQKQGVPYKDLSEIISNAVVTLDDDTRKIITKNLTFPVPMTNEELFEFIEFYFLYEFDEAVYLDMYATTGEISIQTDKHFGGFMLALVGILFVGVVAFIIMISR